MDKARKIAAPVIAEEIGSLNLLLATAGDVSLSQYARGTAINDIRKKFVEYFDGH